MTLVSYFERYRRIVLLILGVLLFYDGLASHKPLVQAVAAFIILYSLLSGG